VVAVTSGPGVLNAMTGLASAWCDGLPVLLLVGEVPRRSHGKGVLQDGSSYGLNIVQMAGHVTKMAAEIPTADQVPHYVRRAITTALSGRRGPVILTLPLDVTTTPIVRPQLSGSVTLETHVAPSVLDEILCMIEGAERPLILAGSGCRGSDTPAAIVRVAELLRCPVATTPKGKGVFPESHPLALGVIGIGGHPSASAYLDAGIDVLIAVGTSLGDLATDSFSPLLQAPKGFVHIDIDARQIGKSYAPTHAVVASADDLFAGLELRLGAGLRAVRPMPAAGVTRHRLPSSETTEYIAPQDAIAELQRILPRDTIYTADSGEHMIFATHFLELDHPDKLRRDDRPRLDGPVESAARSAVSSPTRSARSPRSSATAASR